MLSMRGLAGRFVIAAAVVAVLVTVAVLRFRQVSRPRFVSVAKFAHGRVERGEVRLGSRRLGESVACAGRERIARIGARGFRAVTQDPGRDYVLIVDEARVMLLRARDCARYVHPVRSTAWVIDQTSLTLTVAGKPERLEYSALQWITED